MKILLINNLYGRHARGGAEFVVELEATGLRARGHEVAVVSAVPLADIPPEGVCVSGLPESLCNSGIGYARSDNGIEHFTYHPPNSCFYGELGGKSWLGRLMWHWLDIFNWRSARQMQRIIKAYQPDVVHTHNLMGLGFTIPNLLWKMNLRHVHAVHDVQLVHPSGLLLADWRPHWLHEWLYIWLMRLMMGSPQVVIFPSIYAKDKHNRFGFFSRSTKTVLRNPAPKPTSAKVRKAESAKGFLFVGQLEEHKGVLDLLDAWEKWTDRGEATLAVVGDGSLRAEIATRAESMAGVEFDGPIFGDLLNEYYNEAAYVVVPSRIIENAPMVILGAFSHGVPVLGAKSGGIPELVAEGKTGLLFASGNVDSLVKGLRRASLSTNWSDMSAIALKTASIMSEETHIDGLEGAYRVSR